MYLTDNKKTKVSVMISNGQLDRLKDIAEAREVSLSDVIREAIRDSIQPKDQHRES